MSLTRRQSLLTVGAVALSSCVGGPRQREGAAQNTEPLSGEALYDDLVKYAEVGHHRTGFKNDRNTFAWIEQELKQAGAQTSTFDYSAANFDLESCRLKIANVQFDAFPLWMPIEGGAEVRGVLCEGDGPRSWAGAIPVFVLEGIEGLRRMRGLPDELERAGASGAICITRTAPGSYYAANSFKTCSIPILIVGNKDENEVLAAVERKREAILHIRGETKAIQSSVVVGQFGPSDKPPIYLSTPLSAFTQAAGERGCGVALFLGLARKIAEVASDQNYVFLAETGHEIHSPGLQAFMAEHGPEPSSVSAWVHLGANIATYEFSQYDNGLFRTSAQQTQTRLLTNNDAYLPMLENVYGGSPYTPELSTRSRGTSGFFMSLGYPVIGFEGGSAHHHTPDDTPSVTGPELLGRAARLIVQMLDELEASSVAQDALGDPND